MRPRDYTGLLERLPATPGLKGLERQVKSAVLIPFVMFDGEYHLVFEKRAASIAQGDEVCFPGGIFDAAVDTSLVDTAVRETVEEIGILPAQIRVDGCLDTFLTFRGVTVTPFIGILQLEQIDDLRPVPEEVDRVFSLPVALLRDHPPEIYHVRLEVKPSYIDEAGEEQILLPVRELGLPQRYAKSWGYHHRRVHVFKTPEGIIWGLTADILVDLLSRIP
jgi:peroxisomal coenzyme A diphosphatase NUDT7